MLLLTLGLQTQNTAKAQTCDDVLSKCRNAVNMLEVEVEQLELGLADTRDAYVHLSRELKEEKEKNSAWYKNPYLLIGVGLITGVIIAK